MAFPACNKTSLETTDDLETPEYAEEAVKYTITDEDSIYESVELTESGDYIIIKRTDDDDYYDYENASLNTTTVTTLSKVTALSNKSLFKNRNMPLTRGSYSGILYGTYTKTGTNEYYLNDIGTLKITSAESSLYQLVITYTDGSTETIPGKMESKIDDSTLVNKLCRTWGMDKYELFEAENGVDLTSISGSTLYELYSNLKKWAEQNDDEYDADEYDDILDSVDGYDVTDVIFTKSGTYVVYYDDGTLTVAQWKLLSGSETEGKLQYYWNIYDQDDQIVYFHFTENTLIVEEKEIEEEDGVVWEEGVRYYLTEK